MNVSRLYLFLKINDKNKRYSIDNQGFMKK
jgi:hypothetical protein